MGGCARRRATSEPRHDQHVRLRGRKREPYPCLELDLHVPSKLSVRHNDGLCIRVVARGGRRRIARYRGLAGWSGVGLFLGGGSRGWLRSTVVRGG
jgi:hypothetical protein